MTIDLMALAKKAEETFIEVENSLVGMIRVYHVPDVMLLSVGPERPEPELPTVRMKTATGYQNRAAKPGDQEYDRYLADKAAYEDESFQLRAAVAAVSALRDIDWSKYDLSGPPPINDAIKMYEGNWPKLDLLRKKAWLDWTILLKRGDGAAIGNAMKEMNGVAEPTDEMVSEVKKNSASSSEQSQND
jgi:hypothetical protein